MSSQDIVLRRPAVFFDRDGVLNVDTGFVHNIEHLVWSDQAAEAVRLCNTKGFLVFVVTNQSGVARGLFDEAAVASLHKHMLAAFAARSARIDDVRYCPHLEDAKMAAYRIACNCRKPKPGMLLDLMEKWCVDRPRSFFIGDKPSDLEAASAAGIAGYTYSSGSLLTFIEPLLRKHGG